MTFRPKYKYTLTLNSFGSERLSTVSTKARHLGEVNAIHIKTIVLWVGTLAVLQAYLRGSLYGAVSD
jgi:hypothetical protein